MSNGNDHFIENTEGNALPQESIRSAPISREERELHTDVLEAISHLPGSFREKINAIVKTGKTYTQAYFEVMGKNTK